MRLPSKRLHPHHPPRQNSCQQPTQSSHRSPPATPMGIQTAQRGHQRPSPTKSTEGLTAPCDHRRPPPAKPAEGSIAQPIHSLGRGSHRRPLALAEPMGSTGPPKHLYHRYLLDQDGHQSPTAKPWGLTVPPTPHRQVLAAYPCQHRPNANRSDPERRNEAASACRNTRNFCYNQVNNNRTMRLRRMLPK